MYIKVLKSKLSLIVGVIMVLFSLLFRDPMFRNSFRFSIQALAFFLIVPSIDFYSPTSIIKRVLENKIILFIGRLSYSLYLFHWMFVIIADTYLKKFSMPWVTFVLGFSLLFASASYFFVEQPFVALRRKFGSDAVNI